jgi:hypothetical protein
VYIGAPRPVKTDRYLLAPIEKQSTANKGQRDDVRMKKDESVRCNMELDQISLRADVATEIFHCADAGCKKAGIKSE